MDKQELKLKLINITVNNLKLYINNEWTPEKGKEQFGLCDNVIMLDEFHNPECELIEEPDIWLVMNSLYDDITQLFKQWPQFSGSITYPVEGNGQTYFANKAVRKANDRTDMYMQKRLHLAYFLYIQLGGNPDEIIERPAEPWIA